MNAVSYKFALPFDLAVPEDRGFDLHVDERKVGIKVDREEGFEFTSFSDESLESIQSFLDESYMIGSVYTDGDDEQIREIIIDKESGAFSGGVKDKTIFSVIHIVIECDEREIDPESDIDRDLFDPIAKKVLSRFLRIYKLVT